MTAGSKPFEDLYARVDERTRNSRCVFRERHPAQRMELDQVMWEYMAAGHSELVLAFLTELSIGRMSKAQFVARYHCVVERFVTADPRTLRIPLLIIESDNDSLVEPILRDQLKATYPRATVHTLHQIGHFPYLNEAERYTQLVEAFLAQPLEKESLESRRSI